MYTNLMVSPAQMAQIADGKVALTQEQLAALHAEIANDPAGMGYAGKSALQLRELLNTPYSRENPQPQGRVPRATVPQDEYILLINRIVLRGDQLEGPAAAIWQKVKSAAEGMRFQASVNLADPDVQMGVAALTQLGLLALREGEAVSLGDLLLTVPDPAWQAETHHSSRTEVLFGINVWLEASDVEAAL